MVGYWTLKSLLEQRNFEKFVETLKTDIQFGQLGVNYPYECPVLVALLHIACQSKGCHKFVEILLQNGADINQRSEEPFSRAAINFAVENRDLETLKILLNDPNCDVNTLPMDKYSALHYAVKHDDIDCIQLLLQHPRIDVNVVGYADQTPLHLALNNNCRKAIYQLLECSDIDLDVLRDNSGHTCRQLINSNYPEFAIKISQTGSMTGENENLFSLLHENNTSEFCKQVMISKPSSTDHDGKYTYLQYACYYGLVEVVEILLTAGIDPNQHCPNTTVAPIMITIERGYHAILKLLLQDTGVSFESINHNEVSRILIDGILGAKNATPSDNLECDHFKCLQYLLTSTFCSQFDINHSNGEGYTLLHCAIILNNVEIMNDLLNVGAQFNLDMNYPDKKGDTPLHYAVELQNEEIIKLLLDAGPNYNVDINKQNDEGNTPLHHAIIYKNEEIIKLLLDTGPNYNLDINKPNKCERTPLHLAIYYENKEIVKLLLDAGRNHNLDINKPSECGNTPLHYAITKRNKEIIKDLLDAGLCYNLNINAENLWRNTPLHCAVREEGKEIIKLILESREYHLDINKPNLSGYTPLNYAVSLGNGVAVEVLLAAGTDFHLNIDWPDKCGYTPLCNAVSYGIEGITKALLHAGAHVGQLTLDGKTPLHLMQGSVLQEYLDKCISTNEKALTDPEYEIIFDYSFITPKQEFVANEKIIEYNTEMESLLIMSNTPELRKVLTHPVLLGFLKLRWYTISKYFYIFLFLHFIFYILLTTYICYINHSPSNHNYTQLLSLYFGNSSEYLNSTQFPNNTSNTTFHYKALGVDFHLWYVLIVSCVIFALKELYQFHTSHKQYLRSVENWLEMCLICLTFTLLLYNMNSESQHKLSSIIIIILGMDLMFLIGRHPLCSTYIEMFKAVIINFLKLIVCYLVLILSIALSFYILFKNDTQEKNLFRNPALAVLKSITMLTGEFEMESIPLNTSDLASYFLFILFVFLIAVVLYNLSNGLAVSDTQAIQSDVKLVAIVSKVKLISYMTGVVIPHFLKCIHFVHIIVWYCVFVLCGKKMSRDHELQSYERTNSPLFYRNKMYITPNDHNIAVLKKLDLTEEKCQIDSYIVEHAKRILEKNKQQEKEVEERDSQKERYISTLINIDKLFQVHKNELEIIVDSKLKSVENKLETVDNSLKIIMEILKLK